MPPKKTPIGDPAREAIDSLRGYVYQIYQSALAWTEIKADEYLFLEVAEDFAVAAEHALKAVQVKETASSVTINSDDIVASIDSFVEVQEKNPSLNVSLRHLTTSSIGKEKQSKHRIGDTPTLISWRNLAKAGDLSDFRKILDNSKLSEKTKDYIRDLDDTEFREQFLKKIHFDCGALNSHFLAKQLNSRVSGLLIDRGGAHSQATNCTASILLSLLTLSTKKNRDDRFVERSGLEELLEAATKVILDRAQFDAQTRLVERALSASVSSAGAPPTTRITRPSPVSEVPLPKALADRSEDVGKLLQSLEHFGSCWISGAAGMGKTVAARVLAHKTEGDWASINLRGLTSEQVAIVLSDVATSIPNYCLQGLIIDDLDCALEPSVSDSLHYLFHSADRSDVLVICTAPNPPTAEFLFVANLQSDIVLTLKEFTEENIQEILDKLGVSGPNWAKYIHLVSGGGHPQLAIAFIQSMDASGWDREEFQTLNALLSGSPALEDVRKRTRERLLKDLPESGRRLIERLSLQIGGFKRELALDIAKVAPPIPDAGIVLDSLTGSWIDQHEGDRFNLSPLLSDFAAKTLTIDDKKEILSAIAGSLTKGRSLDVTDMDSALAAAWASNNTAVIIKLCVAVLVADQEELEMLAPHLLMFTLFRTDTVAYPNNPEVSQLFRGAQILLLNQESNSESKLDEALSCFVQESTNVQNASVRASMNLIIYSKLLIQTSKTSIGLSFLGVIENIDRLLENNDNALLSDTLREIKKIKAEGVSSVGFMFLNQVRQLSNIDELKTVFEFIDNSSPELRAKLLQPFERDDFDIDMLVAGAWLSEHKNDTIVPPTHSNTFAHLEKQAASWNHTDLAVCCRKYQAIILDEYGDDKESALAVLDEGLDIYGHTNSELVRAKAKVLYRSEDHKESLALSKTLIESDIPMSEVEKAFLGRDAAISAEKQGDLDTARRYYLYGSDAAKKSGLPDMAPMRVGLLADAALASWHDGHRQNCLQDFIVVLNELNQFAPDETLRTAHCHAVTRHVLLWLEQDVNGDKILLVDGEETKIYPGCVSNPEPHPDISSRHITPIDMAWYMLATVENYAELSAGITENLDQLLPNGPVYEGQILLAPAKMHKALACRDEKLFVGALTDTISHLAFIEANGGHQSSFDIENVTGGQIPLASKKQQNARQDFTEQFVLLYCTNCIFKADVAAIVPAVQGFARSSGFTIRPALVDRLQSAGPAPDFYTAFAQLVLSQCRPSLDGQQTTPHEIFEFAFKSLQMAQRTRNYRLFAENMLPWLQQRWQFVLEHQRFLLSNPSLHEASIETALNQEDVSAQTKIVDVLTAILPTLDINNQLELEQIINNFPKL